jgi:hypothetical protein
MLEAIRSSSEIARLQALVGQVIDRPNHLSLDWLTRQGWDAVPTESASYFVERTASRLANACQLLGQTECYAIATEPVKNAPLVYRLSTETDALLEFGEMAYPMLYVLVPENLEFAVLLTPDYELVAGPHPFVVSVLGTTVAEARSHYAAFFTSDKWSDENRHWFESVIQRYQRFGS